MWRNDTKTPYVEDNRLVIVYMGFFNDFFSTSVCLETLYKKWNEFDIKELTI